MMLEKFWIFIELFMIATMVLVLGMAIFEINNQDMTHFWSIWSACVFAEIARKLVVS